MMTSSSISKPPIFRLIGLQCVLTLAVVVVSATVAGKVAAYSALLGGLIVTLPNAYFAWRAFAYNRTRSASKVMAGFMRAEAAKFGLTALFFGLVFKFVQPLHASALFMASITVLVVGAVASAAVLQGKR